MKPYTLATLALSFIVCAPAQAHDTWILPSATSLSGNNPWVTFDAAAGNDLFFFNHKPLPLSGLSITSPTGKAVPPANVFSGELRSGFDVQLSEPGTYRIALARNGISAQWTDNGKPQRWFGSAAEFAANVPAKASNLHVQQRSSRVETFVTRGKPTGWAPSAEGIALEPRTHPNDLFKGETARFAVLLDGQPLAHTQVQVVPEGRRYRDKVNTITLTTNARGEFAVQWPLAGRYWLHVEHQGPAAPGAAPATERHASYSATLEVLP